MSIKVNLDFKEVVIGYYHTHPCRVHGIVYPSIKQAAEATGENYQVLRKYLHENRRGYKLLPYDGVLPKQTASRISAPHVYVEGKWYHSQREAAQAIGVGATTIWRRIHDPNYLNYFVLL